MPRSGSKTPGISEQPARRWTWIAMAGLAALVLIYVFRCAVFWHYVNDDAFITFRYSRFLALGRGPYFNIGEHVEGYTNFLLMLLLVPVFWLGGETWVPLAAKLIGVLSGLGSLMITWRLTRLILSDDQHLRGYASVIGVGAAALVVASPAYAINSTSGLATTLFSFLLILGVYLAIRAERRRSWCGAGIAFSALVLTRPEGALLFAICWIGLAVGLLRHGGSPDPCRRQPPDRLWSRVRHDYRFLWLDGIIVIAVFVGHVVFRWVSYDGEWLPNTYFAKAGGFWKVDAWVYINKGILFPFFGPPGVALAICGMLVRSWQMRPALGLLAVGAAGALLPFVTGTDWMLGWRLLMHYLPAMACVVGVGWATMLGVVLRNYCWPLPLAIGACALLLGWRQLPIQNTIVEKTTVRSRGYETGHRALAEWLRNEAAQPGDAVALMDIGIIGYLCSDQTIIDISGLTDPFIAKSEGTFLRKVYDPRYILGKRPRFIVLTATSPGTSYEPLPPNARLGFSTRVELRIFEHHEFTSRYRRVWNTQSEELSDWKQHLARRLGAVRVFEHGYPGMYYLLVVFEAIS